MWKLLKTGTNQPHFLPTYTLSFFINPFLLQVDAYDRANPQSTETSDIDKTSLKDAIATFDRCFMTGMWRTIRAGFKAEQDKRAAESMDF